MSETRKCPDCGGEYKPKNSGECPWCEYAFLRGRIKTLAIVIVAHLKEFLPEEKE